jgi:hypothetical protein
VRVKTTGEEVKASGERREEKEKRGGERVVQQHQG